MTNLMIRIVTLATFLMALIAAASFTPAFGAGGGGGGGGGGGDTTSDPRDQRSTYPQPSGTKATPHPQGQKESQAVPFRRPRFCSRVTAKPMRPSMTAMNMPRPSSS